MHIATKTKLQCANEEFPEKHFWASSLFRKAFSSGSTLIIPPPPPKKVKKEML